MPDARAFSGSIFAAGRVCGANGLRMQVIDPQGKQRQGCGTPPCRLPQPRYRPASRQPCRGQEEQSTRPKERSRLSSGWRAAASTSTHICSHLPGSQGMPECPWGHMHGKGQRSLTFHIRRCLDRNANPCAFASLCHACRWSGGQHPLRYGRDIRHSWCLTLSPSGTFSP